MAEAEGESLESWLNKATNPSNRQEDWEYIIGFCDQVNTELEGPQIAVRLLAHKIQSPQEWEAAQALTVLEACMKNCGRRFHNEVGKFRFLNELIKVVSPKYLGDRASERVRTKVIELLFSWTLALPEESKIKDAYHMLKRQGIVHCDPLVPIDRTLIPSPPPRPRNPVFDDEEKSKLLARLLQSKNPDDLQEANKLIKSMVKEDEARIQKVMKRLHTLEEVNNNAKLLHEMLLHYSRDDSSQDDKELMKELFDRCENKRRTLFRLASETEDNDNSLGDILQASDNLSRVINSYKVVVDGELLNGDATTSLGPDSEGNCCHGQGALIDLAEPDTPDCTSPGLAPSPPSSSIPILPPPPQTSAPVRSCSSSQAEAPARPPGTNLSLLDEELLCLGLADPAPCIPLREPAANGQWPLFQSRQPELDFLSSRPASGSPPAPALAPLCPTPASGLAAHTGSLFAAESRAPGQASASTVQQPAASGHLLEQAQVTSSLVKPTASGFFPGRPPARPLVPFPTGPGSPLFQAEGSPVKGPELSLASVHVPLESIKPSSALPVTAYDKNGFRILFHFAKESPPGRPDVLVVVVSMLNTAPLPIRGIVLQAAVPKSMKVKLQPPSGTELAPFSPAQPPAALTQVMLLANPLKVSTGLGGGAVHRPLTGCPLCPQEKARLRYKLTFALGEQLNTEVGEVDQFPPAEQWGNL